MTKTVDLAGEFRHALEACGEHATCELGNLLRELIGGTERVVGLHRLKSRVFRLDIADGIPSRAVVLKRLEPAVAQRNQLLVERWLPALGLEDRCARLLGVAAEARADCVWHVYEDLGDETLAVRPDPERVRAAVELAADLHTRASHHRVLPEVRRYSSSRGQQYFIENVRDAIDALDALAASGIETPRQYAGIPNRLRERLMALLADAPRRTRVAEKWGGPDTMVHGDLWPINIFVRATPNGPRARLVDWDRLAVGPFSYDLSTFLFRLPAASRPQVLEHYRNAVADAAWCLASPAELEMLFDTAERARYANTVIWPVKALLEERAEWGFPQLADIERWFIDLDSDG
ncbi:MAG: hypothetical protein DMF84_15960 [Acidobacteria bacterium]|nr:MAG: hypothetical protein DMF84_15960 [Acidobacteriota bacterium]